MDASNQCGGDTVTLAEGASHMERLSFITEENNEELPLCEEDEGEALFRSDSSFEHIQQENSHHQRQQVSITFLNGLALVVGLQIGSGIFTVPYQVSNHVSSPGVAIIIWLVSGLLVWTGASSFIELGLAVPRNGGIQEYLRHCYGDFYGFLFTWVWVLISKPAAMAIISMVFAEYLCRTFSGGETASLVVKKLVAFLGLTSITFLNCLGAKTGAYVANGFLILKLFAVLSIAVLGIKVIIDGTGEGVGHAGQRGWFETDSHAEFRNVWSQVGDLVTALYGALFCYGGWETNYIQIGFVVGEMQDPKRDLPRIINSAMILVIFGFSLLNVALYVDLPFKVMREKSTVAVEFGLRVLGHLGGPLYSLIVSASAMGTLNANVFATGRLCVAASQRHYFPKILANMHFVDEDRESDYYQMVLRKAPRPIKDIVLWFAGVTSTLRLKKQVPVYAMVMNSSVASLYIVLGTFNSLITFVGISEYFFFFFAVLGIFILRTRDAKDAPSYRTWTWNPIIFCVVSGFLVIRGIISDVFQGLAIFLLIPTAFAVYRHWFQERANGID